MIFALFAIIRVIRHEILVLFVVIRGIRHKIFELFADIPLIRYCFLFHFPSNIIS